MNQVPKIVRQRLGVTSDPSHPDANVLSAYAQKALDQGEEATILGHLAQCADCRQILLLAQPELEAAPQVVGLPAKAPAGLHGMRWAFWASAVLVVGGLLMLNDRQQSSHDQIAQVAPPTMTQSTAASPSPAAAPTDEGVAPAVAANAEAKAETGIMPKTQAQPASSRPTEVATLDQLQGASPAPSVHSENSPARNSSLSKESEAKASGAKENNDAAAGAFVPRAAFAGDAKAEASRMAANAMVLSKTSGPRWTLTPDGVLQRSFDAGQTWETVTVTSNATFRVVSALGSDIWVGGAAGALYHSKDAGQHWEQVKPAVDGNALTADITGLEFSDAQHGKVASASGLWTTSDAGQTWQKQ
jgi:hypothetical protein